MILGIYATLGVSLLVASQNPLAHLSLIWFTVWSSIVHGGIMAAQSLVNSEHMGHLWGDVLALVSCGSHPGDSDAARRGSETCLACIVAKPDSGWSDDVVGRFWGQLRPRRVETFPAFNRTRH
jgi:hypothetical protein